MYWNKLQIFCITLFYFYIAIFNESTLSAKICSDFFIYFFKRNFGLDFIIQQKIKINIVVWCKFHNALHYTFHAKPLWWQCINNAKQCLNNAFCNNANLVLLFQYFSLRFPSVCWYHLLYQQALKIKNNEGLIISGCPIDGAISVRVDSRFGSYRWFVYITTPLLRDASWILILHCGTALLCKQTTDNFRTRHPPEPRWRHLSGNRILFVPHLVNIYIDHLN